MGWLSHWMGLDDSSGPIYMFLSGFGGDLGEAAILGGLFASYKHHTCHVDHPRFCWRLGTHPVVGTSYRTCKKHHPDVPDKITPEHIVEARDSGVS